MANFPVPGDKVDLMVTLNSAETLLLQNVSILAIGQATATKTAGTASTTATTTPANTSGLYTFDVTPTNAEKIALAEQQGLGIYTDPGAAEQRSGNDSARQPREHHQCTLIGE